MMRVLHSIVRAIGLGVFVAVLYVWGCAVEMDKQIRLLFNSRSGKKKAVK